VSKYQGTYRYKATREEIERVIRDLSWTVEEKGNSFGFSLRGLGAWRSVSDTNSSNLIYAKVGVNLWSWGERITVNLAKKTIKSEAAVLLDFGKNKENVNKLKERIDNIESEREAVAEAKARKLPNIVCRVEKSGNAYRAWSTDGYDYTSDINSGSRRKALEGNYLLGRFRRQTQYRI